MNRKKTLIILIIFLLTNRHLYSQEIKHSVSVFLNNSNAKQNVIEQEGLFLFENKSKNIGVDYTLSKYIPSTNNLFVTSGIRLNFSRSGAKAIVTVPGFNKYFTELKWSNSFYQITAPLYLGKTFTPFNNSFQIDAFAGMGLGVIWTAEYIYSETLSIENNNELIGMGMHNLPRKFDTKFLATLDAGFNFTPIAKFPNIKLGMFISYNLCSSANVIGGGYMENATQGIYQNYFYTSNSRFTNVAFTLSYNWGRKWKNKFKSTSANYRDVKKFDTIKFD